MTVMRFRLGSKLWLSGLLVCSALLGSACSSTPKDEFADVTTDQLYADAKEYLQNGSYEQAAKRYEKLEARAAGTLIARQSQLDLAYAYYKNNDRPQALATVERFIKLNPGSPALDYAYYLKGLINFNESLGVLPKLSKIDLSERDQQASRDSYQSFLKVVQDFPESRYADDSRLRMNYIINSLAAYEVHVARYYFKRGAYLAAVNRAKQTLEEFPTAPATEEALYLMMSSYQQLGLPELRASAEQVLLKNFPQTKYIDNGPDYRTKHWWSLW